MKSLPKGKTFRSRPPCTASICRSCREPAREGAFASKVSVSDPLGAFGAVSPLQRGRISPAEAKSLSPSVRGRRERSERGGRSHRIFQANPGGMNDRTRRTLIVDPVWDFYPDFAAILELSCGALLDSQWPGRPRFCGFSIKRPSFSVTFFLFRPLILYLPVPPPAYVDRDQCKGRYRQPKRRR